MSDLKVNKTLWLIDGTKVIYQYRLNNYQHVVKRVIIIQPLHSNDLCEVTSSKLEIVDENQISETIPTEVINKKIHSLKEEYALQVVKLEKLNREINQAKLDLEEVKFTKTDIHLQISKILDEYITAIGIETEREKVRISIHQKLIMLLNQ